jgi:predicted ATPase
MQKLPPETQEVLSLAACLGAEFNLYSLAIISEKSPSELLPILNYSGEAGLIIPLSELDEQLLIQEYKFAHDRIQQGAYALIEDSKKSLIHLKIGRLLWQHTAANELSEKIFKIVDHLNLGYQLISEEKERELVANLNLLAAQKAKAANAQIEALKYIKIAQKLNVIKVIKYEDCYGEIKKSALVKFDSFSKPCEIDDFHTKDEIEEKYKSEIEKTEKQLKSIQENYNNFKK